MERESGTGPKDTRTPRRSDPKTLGPKDARTQRRSDPKTLGPEHKNRQSKAGSGFTNLILTMKETFIAS